MSGKSSDRNHNHSIDIDGLGMNCEQMLALARDLIRKAIVEQHKDRARETSPTPDDYVRMLASIRDNMMGWIFYSLGLTIADIPNIIHFANSYYDSPCDNENCPEHGQEVRARKEAERKDAERVGKKSPGKKANVH